jgi:mannosyltransferase
MISADSKPNPKQLLWKQHIAIIGILLLAISLYGYQLGSESLWFDEAFSIESALGPLNLNRPLYFLMLRQWLRLGDSELWLRGLSVLWGLLSVGLVYRLGQQWVGKTTGLMAALLFTLSPLAINHAQEVRFYMMSTSLGLAGTLALTETLLRFNRLALLSWMILRLLAILTAQVNLLLLLPDGILLVLRWNKVLLSPHFLKRWGWVAGVLLIPLAIILRDLIPPLLEFASQSYTLNGVTATKPNLINLVGALATFTAWPLRAPWPELSQFYQPFYNGYALGVVGVMAFAVLPHRMQKTSRIQWAAIWGFSLVLSIFAAAQVSVAMWGDRYLLVAAPYIFILLAEGIRLLWQRRRRIALFLIVMYAIAVGSALIRYFTVPYRHDWRGLVQTIQTQKQKGDQVILYPEYFQAVFDYYYRDPANRSVVNRDSEVADTTKILETTRADQQRYWLVFSEHDDWDSNRAAFLDPIEKAGFKLQPQQTIRSQWGEDVNLSLAVRP